MTSLTRRHHEARLRSIRLMGMALMMLSLLCIGMRYLGGAEIQGLHGQFELLDQLLDAEPLGYTILGSFFSLLGLFCLASVWRKRMFLG